MGEVSFKVQDHVSGKKQSNVRKYMKMVIGRDSILFLIKYEIIVLFFSRMPGAMGVWIRSKLYPLILGEVGGGVLFGANITLRHPHKIRIAEGTIIDDNVMLDAKGSENTGITIGKDCFIGRNTILSCKDGNIVIKDGAMLGFNCQIYSAKIVEVGRDNLISAYTYLVGGGNYDLDQADVPINRSLREDRARGVRLADDVWIGAHSVVLDGATVGEGGAAAAGSVVSGDVPARAVVAGAPARIVKERPRKPSEGRDERARSA